MLDSSQKRDAKFRQTPFGKLLTSPAPSDSCLEPYTLALLNCSTSNDLYNSYRLVKSSHKQRSIYEVPRGPVVFVREEVSVCWQRIEVNGWKPETRQEASLSCINDKLILIGGVSRSISRDVNLFHLPDNTWEKIRHIGETNEPRFGHSAVKYQGNVIIFGGGTNYDYKHQLRECLSGVHVFYAESHKWEYVKTSGTYLPARKYHSASVVGAHMFIYGGMNQKNNLLSDAAVLQMQKHAWKAVDILGQGPGKLAFHGASLVMHPLPLPSESIYKFASSSPRIRYPGIYFFGGLGGDKKATNTLCILKIGKRPLEWYTPCTSGQAPSPRFLHTSLYNSQLNLLLVFGGRVDLDKTAVYTCFNDVFLLDLQTMTWLTVNVLGEIPLGRSGHTSETVGSKIYVFGGITNACYCSGDMWTLELDSLIVQTMGERYKKKIEYESAVEDYKINKFKENPRGYSKSLTRSHTRRFTSLIF